MLSGLTYVSVTKESGVGREDQIAHHCPLSEGHVGPCLQEESDPLSLCIQKGDSSLVLLPPSSYGTSARNVSLPRCSQQGNQANWVSPARWLEGATVPFSMELAQTPSPSF